MVEAPVAQLIKRWSADLAVSGSTPAGGGYLKTVNGVPVDCRRQLYCLKESKSKLQPCLKESKRKLQP